MSSESSDRGLVTYHREDHVGFVTLNRPDKRNALNHAVWEALGAATEMAREDKEARVVLLCGAGKSFCAGLDLSPENEVISTLSGEPSAAQKMSLYKSIKHIQDIHTRFERLPQPTIGLIHGHCLGAGLELALCCDIRLCSVDTTFAMPEAKLAIITDVGGLQRLPKVVGPGHAREIAFRGHRFDAERALAINLVNDLYPDKQTLDAKGLEMAREIASNPPLAVQGAKDVFLYNETVPIDQALDYTAARSSMVMPSEDIREAISAYLQKREGNFKGA
ncbi:MAG: enoyl-CoA hydratase/isomerase family protein [Desulfomonile tiedjei]|nr:enoyl-CoA hydratase/isomerase family protein [Desulfomonile tiedjei]